MNEWYLDKSVRGQGQGKRLMQLILNDITVNFSKKSIVLSAQVEVSSFYRSLGFITQGEVYDDGGSLTSSPSMSLDKKSQMHNSDPLPLDLQFSLPAVMIMILLCLGYASFYDLVMQALELLILFCSHGNRILATSIVGKIWFYSSGIVDSEPFYNQFKETKLLR